MSPSLRFLKNSSAPLQISSVIKQNNTIIELLIRLHKKLDLLISKNQSSELSVAFEGINAKLANLKIDPASSRQVVPKQEKVIAVWKDPKQQIEAYKKQKDKKKEKA